MRAISPDMRKAALACQDRGRPHVLNTVENQRNTTIMSHDIAIPRQRAAEQCPPWCDGQHSGGRSHWADGPTTTTRTSTTLMVDLKQADGGPPQYVLHDSDCAAHTLDEVAAEQFAFGILELVAKRRRDADQSSTAEMLRRLVDVSMRTSMRGMLLLHEMGVDIAPDGSPQHANVTDRDGATASER